MKKKSHIAIAIGAMCVLLTGAIVVQLNTISEATKIVGTTYAEERLKDEVLARKEEYEDLYKTLEETELELEKVRQEATKENEKGAKLEERLSEINRLLGLTEITGSGVIVTLSDNTAAALDENPLMYDVKYYLIHNEDLINIVNELFNAGAEAISINGQRLITTTSINCVGTVITVNGVKLSSPFEIKAIGYPESLYGITRPGGYYELIKDTGSIATIEKSNNITVEKYSGTITSKYMKTVE